MPIGQKKAPLASQYVGQAKPAHFGFGEDFELQGYWLHPTKHLNAEVAIFDHSYYPKKDATNSEIDSNVTWRRVSLPSLQELRSQGISIDAAMVVTQVTVPPRHIRNRNFFRTNFPAMVKQLARQHNYAIVFPASDMPSARFERKVVLNLYRGMFSPLIINGKQFTSGRMNFFFTAPKEATRGFKRSFNLEEAWPSLSRKKDRKAQLVAAMIAKELSQELNTQLFPVVEKKLQLKRGSKVHRDIQDFISSEETARELASATNFGKDKGKIRNWIDYTFIPYLKQVAAEEALDFGDAALRFVLVTAGALIIGHSFRKVQDKMPKFLKDFNLGSERTRLDLGGVSLSYKSSKLASKEKFKITKVPMDRRRQSSGGGDDAFEALVKAAMGE